MNLLTVKNRLKAAGNTTGTRNSPEADLASSGIRALLKASFPDCTLHFSKGHFYCSGFIEYAGKFVYFSFSDYRFFPDRVIVRSARNAKDYAGGPNNDTNPESLVMTINALLNSEKFWEVK
jgi:hypothetical protein